MAAANLALGFALKAVAAYPLFTGASNQWLDSAQHR
jgi:hypothetical protein